MNPYRPSTAVQKELDYAVKERQFLKDVVKDVNALGKERRSAFDVMDRDRSRVGVSYYNDVVKDLRNELRDSKRIEKEHDKRGTKPPRGKSGFRHDHSKQGAVGGNRLRLMFRGGR